MKTVTLKPTKKGEQPIKFHEGGLHESLGVPMGEKIPEWKIRAALNGKYGPKAQKQARMMKNVLTGPK